MAAVRCAARRLGGSLLQRAQAEEGRPLMPSRLMRSRHLSTELASKVKEMKKLLYDALSKAGKNPILSRPRPRHPLHPLQETPAAEDPMRQRRYSMRAWGVIELAAKMTLIFMAFAFVFGTKVNKAVEDQAVTKEDQ